MLPDYFKGYYNTFNNYQEQGLRLTFYNSENNNEILIWACESQINVDIMIIIADRDCSDTNSMFNDEARKYAKYFNYEDYDSAVNYTFNVIKKQFKEDFPEISNTKFEMYRSLTDIRRIEEDAKQLDYEDYKDLANFESINEGYFCDLIIMDGVLGLRYSRYCDERHDDFDNLTFEEWTPDLTSSTTLMLGMQNKLTNFIDNEVDYNIKKSNNDLERLKEAKKQIDNDETLTLFTCNRNTRQRGVATFIPDQNEVKVFEGNPDGSDDSIMSYDEFIKNYEFIVTNELEEPFEKINI